MNNEPFASTITPETFAAHNGLLFKDSRLLLQALTHRSYVNEHEQSDAVDNERLEFLGDAIVDFIVSDLLFRRFPDALEGDLTRLRSSLVRTEALAETATLCRVGESLRMGKGEDRNGGRKRLNNLCGAFEAVCGAIYLDQGVGAVSMFVMPHLEARLEQVLSESLDKDARSVLQEKIQAEYNVTPSYRIVQIEGPDHERQYTVESVIGDIIAGIGVGKSKGAASQAAAAQALRRLEAGEYTPLKGNVSF